MTFKTHWIGWGLATFCSMTATLLSLHLIRQHIRHYETPSVQRFVIRIIFMVPVYSIDSVISMYMPDWSLVLDTLRDCYEAYVLWVFYELCCTYVGGEDLLGELLETKPRTHHPFPLHFWHYRPGRRFLFHCKQGILQYVLVKPLCALVAFALALAGAYGEGSFSWRTGYLYITIIDNVSVSISLYCLVLFYENSKGFLDGLKPLRKFLVIKFVIFFSFWQSVLIAIAMHVHLINDLSAKWTAHDVATSIQDFMICCEMLIAAFFHYYAFGWKQFRLPVDDTTDGMETNARMKQRKAVKNTIFMKDVLYHSRDVFHPKHISGAHIPAPPKDGKEGSRRKKGKKKRKKAPVVVLDDEENPPIVPHGSGTDVDSDPNEFSGGVVPMTSEPLIEVEDVKSGLQSASGGSGSGGEGGRLRSPRAPATDA